MGTYEHPIGTRASSPEVTITDEHADLAAGIGGYTHPLFTNPGYLREHTPFRRRVVPGELTLFLLGGLAEQTGLFDESVVALVGVEGVRFSGAVSVGDTLRLDVEVAGKRPTSDARRGLVDFRWRAAIGDGREVLTATITMLCRIGS